jgi:hypothetical protein
MEMFNVFWKQERVLQSVLTYQSAEHLVNSYRSIQGSAIYFPKYDNMEAFRSSTTFEACSEQQRHGWAKLASIISLFGLNDGVNHEPHFVTSLAPRVYNS